MSSAPNISLPKPTITPPISQPFWDNLKQKKLSLQVCQSCDKWIFYPRHHCPYCFGTSLVWREAQEKQKSNHGVSYNEQDTLHGRREPPM
ncbi:zinc ribbon domain-containing protein [Gracilibacillus sp. JCM 18860]|uniref:Zn-ribbon domain-containing OB-fold protein n=1 Tax=Gracilibacillus sp. JCM 18860 TaxID=1306159 RepID=UPI000A768C18